MLAEMLNRNPNPFANNWPPMGMTVVAPQQQQGDPMMEIMERLSRIEMLMGLTQERPRGNALTDELMDLFG